MILDRFVEYSNALNTKDVCFVRFVVTYQQMKVHVRRNSIVKSLDGSLTSILIVTQMKCMIVSGTLL
jgi:hypothetical protein